MTDRLQQIRRDMGIEIHDKLLSILVGQLRKEIHLFLIGSSVMNRQSLRSSIFQYLELNKNVGLHFPEHLFEGQLFSNNLDLLTLETLLAESVDGIVMCIESPGSIAELGAFANHENLSKKLVVYVDKKHEKSRSFINLGPIKLLKKQNRSSVIAINYQNGFDSKHANVLLHHVRELKKKTPTEYNLRNLLVAQRFLLTMSYVIGEYTRKDIIDTLKGIVDDDVNHVITVVDSSLTMLVRRRELVYKNERYALSPLGKQKLIRDLGTNAVYMHLDRLRIKMLNLSLRKYWVAGQS